MNMYQAMFGVNTNCDVILATLNLTQEDCGRFRDCYVCNREIIVYTRNGGGNRRHWENEIGEEPGIECSCPGCIVTYRLPSHSQYLRDEDNAFDSTYATIYFSFPEQFAEGLTALDTGEKWDPDRMWLDMLDGLKKNSAKV